MDDLARWLGEQIDEDERVALAATQHRWIVSERKTPASADSPSGDPFWVAADEGFGAPAFQFKDKRDAEFIAAHDPARVLREIEIDRELLAEYERLLRAHEAHRKEVDRLTQSDDDDPIRRNALRREADYLPAMLHVVERWAKQKAAVYSHRPGFREEWAS